MNKAKIFSDCCSLPYHKIGREELPKKKRDIESLRFGRVTKNQEEIDLCLSCPYKKCVLNCKRLKEHRKGRENNG